MRRQKRNKSILKVLTQPCSGMVKKLGKTQINVNFGAKIIKNQNLKLRKQRKAN